MLNGLIVGSAAGLFGQAGGEPALPTANQQRVVMRLCLIILPCGVTLLQRGPLYLTSYPVDNSRPIKYGMIDRN